MAEQDEDVLRRRICQACHAFFWICRPCDRGQRYCNTPCRASARREQQRQANRRHQHSLAGRQDHRDRQREYRKRCARRRWASRALAPKNVTDQSSPALTSPGNMPEWGSGSASTTARVGSAAPRVGFRALPVWRRTTGLLPPPFLRCVICGRRGHVRDPLPPTLRYLRL
jgi:hypothetical protein